MDRNDDLLHMQRCIVKKRLGWKFECHRGCPFSDTLPSTDLSSNPMRDGRMACLSHMPSEREHSKRFGPNPRMSGAMSSGLCDFSRSQLGFASRWDLLALP